MKPKEIVTLVIALVILGASGLVIYNQLAPKSATTASSSNAATIVVVTPIPTDYNQNALKQLTNGQTAKDFYTPPDLTTGLGNTQLFGQ